MESEFKLEVESELRSESGSESGIKIRSLTHFVT